ncbi:MAG: hypothetical protein JKY50_00400 [Oleispira sp.]|nr:hypothetical protein [Oleispira sp.]
MGRNAKNLDISDYLEDEINKETRRTAIKLYQGLVFNTAVDKGQLKGGWLVSVEKPNFTLTATLDNTAKGTGNVTAGINIIGTAKITSYPTIFIQNRYPYAYRIMETGYSDQTPPKELSKQIRRAVNG